LLWKGSQAEKERRGRRKKAGKGESRKIKKRRERGRDEEKKCLVCTTSAAAKY